MNKNDHVFGGPRRSEGRLGSTLRSLRGAAVCFCLVWPLSAAAQPLALEDGRPAQATHTADGQFVYVATLQAARNYLVRLDQQGLDLILSVESPSGARTVANSPLFRDGSEYVLVENAESGAYRFEVSSEETTHVSGGHAIVFNELSASGIETDAWRAMTQGAVSNRNGGEAGWSAGVEAYDRAAALWRELGLPALAAAADFAAATIAYWQLYDWQGAADRAAAAASGFLALGEAAISANATHLEGAAIVEMALEAQQSSSESDISPQARALFDRALSLLETARLTQQQLGNVYDLGLIINNFGYTYYNMGRFDEARTAYRQAAALLENLGEATAELNPRYNLAALEAEQGYLTDAIATFERILEILPAGRLDHYRANALDHLGAAHLAFGDAEEALQTFAQAMELQTRIEDRQGRGRSLRRIGQTYYGLGELELAAQYLEQALPVAVQTSDGRNQEASLRALGSVAFARGDYAAALDYHERALETAASVVDRARLQTLISKDLRALGLTMQALAIAELSYGAASENVSDALLADAALELGEVHLAIGDTPAAAGYLEQARTLYAGLGLVSSLAAAEHSLALLARNEGRLSDALVHGEASLTQLERLRTRVADPELRAFLAGTRRAYYETQIGLHMALHARSRADDDIHLRRALETSERARARLTADLLQEASIDLEGRIDPQLKSREDELYAALAENSYQHGLLIQNEAEPEALKAVLATLSGLENQLNLLEIDMRRSSPSFASLGSAAPLTAAQVQLELDTDTVLVQYALGDPASFAWIVSRDAIEVASLPARAAIEAQARKALDELGPQAGGQRAPASMRALADSILLPLAEHLRAPRVVLALDGVLQYVPFAALPMADGSPLLAHHELVEIPSMSAVAALRKRQTRAAAAKTLAVFADPVLEPTDSRMAAIVPQLASVKAGFQRSSLSGELVRLHSSAYEAQNIAGLVAEPDRWVASGFDASRGAVLGGELDAYRYIHFATHGLIDARYPGLSALALSSFDAMGRPQDGMLRLHDIYNLDLNADLVVLSACETALGREVRGEGLIGLTQGFMYAGARSVIASLWQVPDRATAELMTRFYRYLIEMDLGPAQALKRAQLDIAAERRWRDPYFWGGFVLLGDWR